MQKYLILLPIFLALGACVATENPSKHTQQQGEPNYRKSCYNESNSLLRDENGKPRLPYPPQGKICL